MTSVHGNRLALLHLCDSLFPVGSYAHSDGLEAAVSTGAVRDATELAAWLDVQLEVVLTRLDGPAIRDGLAAFHAGRFDRLSILDRELLAFRPSSASREASRAQGARLLKTWQLVRPSPRLEPVIAAGEVQSLTLAFAVVCGLIGLTPVEAIEAFFYTRLAAAVSAAMRLLSIGQHEAHRLLADSLGRAAVHAAHVAASSEPSRSFTPALDITIMQHRYVHSRLFLS